MSRYDGPERREMPERHETWLESIPSWARVVAIVGIPGAIALFLVWVGASDLPRISRQVEETKAGVVYNQKLLEQQIIKQEQTYRLLQRICTNTAKTDIERQRCFDQ